MTVEKPASRRQVCVAAAQVGAIGLETPREETVERLKALLDEASAKGVQLVVFPELAFTTFFARHLIDDAAELDKFFETGEITSSANVRGFFEHARALALDVCIGYAEKTDAGEHFNSMVYVDRLGNAVAKYRKIHVPGTVEPAHRPDGSEHLEKRYFQIGNLGFRAFRSPASSFDATMGMLICNDRRWPEAWRVLGLQGVELVLCGYNTTAYTPFAWGQDVTRMNHDECVEDVCFQHRLCMQYNSYANSTWSVSAARAGWDDGKHELIGGSCIVDPQGHIVAEYNGLDDHLLVATIDLDLANVGKELLFNFANHRHIEHYGLISSQTGVEKI